MFLSQVTKNGAVLTQSVEIQTEEMWENPTRNHTSFIPSHTTANRVQPRIKALIISYRSSPRAESREPLSGVKHALLWHQKKKKQSK